MHSHEEFHVGADYSKAVFSPDGSYVAAGTSNGSILIWNVATKELEKNLQEHR